MISSRSMLLSDLREIRNGLEQQADALRDHNLSSLPHANIAQERLAQAILALKQEIDDGEDYRRSHWPASPVMLSSPLQEGKVCSERT
jgi:hypothetical protein